MLVELQAAEVELEVLNLRQIKEFAAPKQTILDDSLLMLFAKQIDSVSVILTKKINLNIVITFKGRTLSIRIKGLKQALRDGWISDYHIEKVEKLGFRRLTKSSEFKYKIQGQSDRLHQEVKMILARLTFDVLPSGSIDKEGFIQIT